MADCEREPERDSAGSQVGLRGNWLTGSLSTMPKLFQWFLNWSGELAKFAFVVFVVGNIALGLTGYLVFTNFDVAKAWGGNMLGFTGAFLGAYAAIWWSWTERERTEGRKRRAISFALATEIDANLRIIYNWEEDRAGKPMIATSSLNALEAHVEFFQVNTISLVFAYKERLAEFVAFSSDQNAQMSISAFNFEREFARLQANVIEGGRLVVWSMNVSQLIDEQQSAFSASIYEKWAADLLNKIAAYDALFKRKRKEHLPF